MNHLSLITLKLIGQLPDKNGDFFETISEELRVAVRDILREHGLSVLYTEMMSHPIRDDNFVQCAECSKWLINREKESDRDDVDEGIKDGALYDGKFLCCDCLPNGHPWHFSNI